MTVKQAQHLLGYLGYDVGTADGIWGSQSMAACKAFQTDANIQVDGILGEQTEAALLRAVAEGDLAAQAVSAETETPTDASEASASDDWWASIKYFKRSEFICHCGKCGGFPYEPSQKLVTVADRVRAYFNSPATVSSGVRCAAHNAEVGGVSNSRHLYGRAMDYSIAGRTASEILAYVQQQPEIAYSYAIDGSFIHMDVV